MHLMLRSSARGKHHSVSREDWRQSHGRTSIYLSSDSHCKWRRISQCPRW